MALGDTTVAGIQSTLGSRDGTMPSLRAAPWSSSAGVPLGLPLRVPVLGHLDRCVGDLEARGAQMAANGSHRRPTDEHPLAVLALRSTIFLGPGALKGGGRHVALPCVPAVAGMGLRQNATHPVFLHQQEAYTHRLWTAPPGMRPCATGGGVVCESLPTKTAGTPHLVPPHTIMLFVLCEGNVFATAGARRGASTFRVVACWAMPMPLNPSLTVRLVTGRVPPPPLSKLRPCPSYSRRRDRINLVPNFNSVPNLVQPHKTWV